MENGVRRWLVNISQWNPSEDQFASLVSLFPVDEQRIITRSAIIHAAIGLLELLAYLAFVRYIKFDDRKRALVSRLLQYSLVREVLGIPFDKIIMHRTIEGKPYLKCSIQFPFPNFNFNTSHHGDYVGIASEPVCLVGLDIVSVKISPQVAHLDFINDFSSYLTALEWKNIANAGTSEEMLAEFYRYWCLKEAFVKAIGAGLGYGLHRLEFHHTNWTNISVYIDGTESRASVAKGLPNKTDDQCCSSLLLPEPGFTLWTVEQLIPDLS